ncbi:TonB-dependent receptor [Novosphingobium decolorationis]|uniref:TonB-dependent receptor n=1 Tax=Novosphingobium decolorationis TaxID=2698673 RepID=A0ABX8E6B6_9SPHN|nr:TonB-dependent receptor [Novosphingobium decolorationis]QVM84490.1 TonB-dependent receptor [Novosphingobium decolorationis]
MRTPLVAGTAMTLALLAQPALGQTTETQATQTQTSETGETFGLNAIIVTAQRRAETLQDAAIAINAASGDQLVQNGVADATQLNTVAPALYVAAGGGANTGYFIRGVGNFANNGYTSPAVAFNIDGVYIGRPSSTVASFLDVNRVEVLKGPQGTLYGRNATGGAINVIPNAPQLGVSEGSVSAQYGNYDAYELTGMVNAPLGNDVALRLAGTVNERDGYFSDGTGSAKDLALRGQIYAELSPAINLRVSADYSTQKGTGPGLNVEGVYTFTPFNPGATVRNWLHVEAPDNVRAPYTGLFTPEALDFIENTATAAPLFAPLTGYAYPRRDDEYWGLNAEVNVDLGGVDLVVIPAYRHSKLDNQFNGPPFKAAINSDTAEQYSLEARLSGTSGPVEWLLGGYWFDETVKGVNSFNQFSTTTFNSFDTHTRSLAAFGRVTWSLTDTLRLVGGLRYSDEKRDIVAQADSLAAICLTELPSGQPSCPNLPTVPVGLTLRDSLAQYAPGLFPAGSPLDAPAPYGAFPFGPFGPMGPTALLAITPTVIDRAASDREVTWRAAVEFDASPDNLVYASFETGFRAGGFNITFGQEEYAPEFIDAWTLGSKNSFFNNSLQLNLEAFYWKYRGQQLAALGLDDNGNNAFYTRNVGKSSVKGVEMDFQWLAGPTTLVHGGAQYLDATYDSFQYNQIDLSDEGDPPYFLTPITGCGYTQVSEPVRSFDIDCSGKPALYAPKWSFNLGVQQKLELDPLDITFALDGRYRANRVIGFAYLPTGDSGADFKMDASIRFEPTEIPVTVMLFVRNLTDQAVQSTYQLGAGNVASSAYEPPRTYGLRVGYTF